MVLLLNIIQEDSVRQILEEMRALYDENQNDV